MNWKEDFITIYIVGYSRERELDLCLAGRESILIPAWKSYRMAWKDGLAGWHQMEPEEREILGVPYLLVFEDLPVARIHRDEREGLPEHEFFCHVWAGRDGEGILLLDYLSCTIPIKIREHHEVKRDLKNLYQIPHLSPIPQSLMEKAMFAGEEYDELLSAMAAWYTQSA